MSMCDEDFLNLAHLYGAPLQLMLGSFATVE